MSLPYFPVTKKGFADVIKVKEFWSEKIVLNSWIIQLGPIWSHEFFSFFSPSLTRDWWLEEE
jgi:hypothetical protein